MIEVPVVLLVAMSPFTIIGFLMFVAVVHALCDFSKT